AGERAVHVGGVVQGDVDEADEAAVGADRRRGAAARVRGRGRPGGVADQGVGPGVGVVAVDVVLAVLAGQRGGEQVGRVVGVGDVAAVAADGRAAGLEQVGVGRVVAGGGGPAGGVADQRVGVVLHVIAKDVGGAGGAGLVGHHVVAAEVVGDESPV